MDRSAAIRTFADPNEKLLIGMGLFALLLECAIQKQVWAAKNWQTTSRQILSWQMEAYQKLVSESGDSHRQTYFKPSVVYAYEMIMLLVVAGFLIALAVFFAVTA